MNRYLMASVEKDMKKKMVWISGPRQCGKTTLAREFIKQDPLSVYLNWDDPDDRRVILSRKWPENVSLLVLDEIHKFKKWKNWLKGTYDKTQGRHRFIVTGSARLDVYRRGGDSLFGRYHAWRLHPLCLAECPNTISIEEAFQRLMAYGGFPEPFLAADKVEAKRWRRERRELVIREDIRDLESIRDITLLSVLLDMLAGRVGGPVVIAHLAADLQVASKTVKHWIEIMERMYLIFTVRPYSKLLPRAIVKPPKIFFFDNADVLSERGHEDRGPRFENLVANHLLKRLHFLEDSQGDRYELCYVRDKEGHEADFLILKERRPICLIEAKWADQEPSRSLIYFGEKLGVKKKIQLVSTLKARLVRNAIAIEPAMIWLAQPLDASVFE